MLKWKVPVVYIANTLTHTKVDYAIGIKLSSIINRHKDENTNLVFYKHDRPKQLLLKYNKSDYDKSLQGAHMFFSENGASQIYKCKIRNGRVFLPWEVEDALTFSFIPYVE